MFLNFTDLFDNTYELLRCFATLAILKTFGFACDFDPLVLSNDEAVFLLYNDANITWL